METTSLLLSGVPILTEKAWLKNHALFVEDRVIKTIVPNEDLNQFKTVKRYHFPNDYYLLPGWIDLHIHGAAGHDVMDGQREAINAISLALAKEGVTGFLATTMSASNDQIENVLQILAHAKQSIEGAAVLGVHLEGPFISDNKKGAQAARFMQLPDVFLIERWQALAKGMIKQVTLAPELPGSLTLIKRLHTLGMIASIGHTNATFAEVEAAIQAGCTHATHLFNAMRSLHHREPGAIGALLLSDQVSAELIVDGIHLHPAIVQLALKLKGKERLLLVTDAMRAKCLEEKLSENEHALGGQTVIVREGRAMLSDGTLAGSTLRMPNAIKNMMQFTGCSLAEAVYCASLNPAIKLGIQQQKGSIAVGKDADLVITNQALEVMMTIREGKIVYCREDKKI